VITIAGTGDHLRPEWPITFTGMRKGMPAPAAAEIYTVPAKRGILRGIAACAEALQTGRQGSL
jgi:hypothetical protein